MQKRLPLFIMLLLFVQNILAQVVITASSNNVCPGSPVTLTASPPTNCNSYTISNISFSPRVLSGSATTVSLSDDAVSSALPIGFDFNFYCGTYSEFRIGSNGFITFNNSTSSGCCSGQSIPNTSNPNNLIAFAWEDLDPGNGGQPAENLIRYETVGTAPNRILIVDFYNVDHFSNGNNVTVQTLLYESTNVIEIHTTTMPSDGGRHTMGIENAGGTIAQAVTGRNSVSWSATNEGIRFSPVICTGVTYDWQSPLGTSIGSGNTITVSPTAFTTYYVVVNSSCGTETASKDIDILFIDAGNDQCTGGGTVTLKPTTNFPVDCSTYDITSIPFAKRSLTGGATSVSLSDDAVTGALPIGFTFNFFCNNYTNFYISSNGFVTFSSGQPSGCCSGQNLPNTSSPNNLVAFVWEDIDPGNGGQPAENVIKYETIGTSPNQILIVDFDNVDHFSNGNNVTVQLLLYEIDNSIEIHTTTMPSDGGNHTMGIENIDGTVAFVVTGRNATSWSATNEGIRIAQSSASTITWTPATGLSNTTILNPDASPATSTNYTITINDGNGCVLSDDVTVSPNCPLPINLVSFSGVCTKPDILFNWTTASEIDNDFFTIERLDEYSGHWIGVKQIKGAGNSNELLNYGIKINNIDGGYFRLKQTDFDGEYEYSSIIKVDCENKFDILGYPNPTKNSFNITINDPEFRFANIEIFDAFGQVVYKNNMFQNQIELDVSNLTAGVYNVNVVTKYYSKVLRLMIQ